MAKFNKGTGITEEEWAALPVVIHIPTMAQLLDSTPRYVSDHAGELGGTKVAGKWCFGKAKVAEQLGIA